MQLSVSDNVVLAVQGVSKKFCRNFKRSLFNGVRDIGSEIFGLRTKNRALRKDEFWALKDISFELKKGDAIGLVGANGAGKTTLLKIITGLIKPDAGSVLIKGRIAPMIALGAGFNPVLSGRENVYVNMSILGLTHAEIDERFGEVVGFAEMENAIDAPVQTYSSGMSARLGFACAVHTNPDILLIDEVLAVGDARFRMKCYRKLAELKSRGVSLIFVSHASQSIISVCDRAVYLSKGNLISCGPTVDVLNKYEEDLFSISKVGNSNKFLFPGVTCDQSKGVDIIGLDFINHDGSILESIATGEELFICLSCRAWLTTNIGVKVIVKELSEEQRYAVIFSSYDQKKEFALTSGLFKIKIHLPYLGLRPGNYSLKLSISKDNINIFDAIENYTFTVNAFEKNLVDVLYYQPHNWLIETVKE